MALPEVRSHHDWLRPGHVDAVVQHLRDFAEHHEGVNLQALAADPYGTLEQHPTLTIEHSDETTDGCAVYGHYRPSPPTIHIVRASTYGRDHFTLLHEYAHHLQQNDPAWADIEWRIEPDALRLRVTEAIANAFASTALIPDAALDGISAVPTARQMAELHQSVRASRQASIVRVTSAAGHAAIGTFNRDDFFVSLAAQDGTVVFSQMVGDNLFQPPRDSHQPDIEQLFADALAANGNATRVTSHGIAYT
ncbi:ImmA/IrrE family metallo-endopeptidase, partial [Nocardioides plantarum]